MSKPRKFNVGDRIGGWTLVEYPYKSKKVLVRCDCGLEAWRWLSNFSAGTSMSCVQCRKTDPIEKTFSTVKYTAARRKIQWNLSFDEWKSLAESNCYYCDSPPSNCILSAGTYRYNGIDRVDSSGIYELSNCVTACRVCNRAKSDMPQNEFYSWVAKVYDRS